MNNICIREDCYYNKKCSDGFKKCKILRDKNGYVSKKCTFYRKKKEVNKL